MESKNSTEWLVVNSDRSLDEEISNPGPCLCGDYSPHFGCVDPYHWTAQGFEIPEGTDEEQATEGFIKATADHLYGPVPVCICGHDLNRHDATGCYAPTPGESFGPEETETCPCSCFDDRKEDR